MNTQIANKRKYIVTCDLAKRFRQFEHLGIKTPDVNDFFGEFDEKLIQLIKKAFPGDDVIKLDIEKTISETMKLVIEKQKELDGFIVSTSVDFAAPRGGAVIEINRLVNEKGEIIGIGPRPGHSFLHTQCSKIAIMADKKPVILVEDGIYSGSTLEAIISGLKEKHVNVSAIIVGFAFPKGLERLKSKFDIDITSIHNNDNLIDWMPDHDFFPFAPNCGRVLGIKTGDMILPLYDCNGLSFSIPYILPFSPMQAWTSIPQDSLFAISYLCMQSAIEFYQKIDKLNGHDTEIRDVINLNPRISASIFIRPKCFPNIHEKIGQLLSFINAECW